LVEWSAPIFVQEYIQTILWWERISTAAGNIDVLDVVLLPDGRIFAATASRGILVGATPRHGWPWQWSFMNDGITTRSITKLAMLPNGNLFALQKEEETSFSLHLLPAGSSTWQPADASLPNPRRSIRLLRSDPYTNQIYVSIDVTS